MAVIFAVFSTCGFAEDLTLATDGSTTYQIVQPTDASPADEYAAGKLAASLQQITGATFPIVKSAETGAARPSTFVGLNGAASKHLGSDPMPERKNQEHVSRSVGPSIFLYGKGVHGPRRKLELKDVTPGVYRLYVLGAITLAPESLIWFSSKSWMTSLSTGHRLYLYTSRAPWSWAFLEERVHRDLVVHHLAIVLVLLHTEAGHHCHKNCLPDTVRRHKCLPFVHHVSTVSLGQNDWPLVELDFAEIDAMVRAINDQIDLTSTGIVRPSVSPGAASVFDAGYAERFSQLVMMSMADAFKSESRPSAPRTAGGKLRPGGRIDGTSSVGNLLPPGMVNCAKSNVANGFYIPTKNIFTGINTHSQSHYSGKQSVRRRWDPGAPRSGRRFAALLLNYDIGRL